MLGRKVGVCAAALAVVLAAGLSVPAKAIDVTGKQVRLKWQRAAGPVDLYVVYVSRNGGPFRGEHVVETPSVTLNGSKGDTLRVRVAGWQYTGGNDGRVGPSSPPSAAIRFVAAGNGNGGSSGNGNGGSSGGGGSENSGGGNGGNSGGSGGNGGSSDSFRAQRVLTTDRSLRVFDTGNFIGSPDDDLVFELPASAPGAFVLGLENGVPNGIFQVTANADDARRGPAEPGAHTLLVRTASAGHLQAWRALPTESQRRWSYPQDGMREAVSVDVDGDGRAEIVRRDRFGRLRWSGGEELPVPPLRTREKLLVGDTNGDGREDLVISDLETGELTVWRHARQRRGAPRTRSGLEAVALVDLEGDGRAELAAVDRNGRLRVRDLFDDDDIVVGRAGRGAQVFPVDLEADGFQEILTVHRGEVDAWRP